MSVDALSDLMPGSSPFHYCFNNPLILRDPSGLVPGDIGSDGLPRFTTGEVVVYGERDNSSEEVIRDRKLEWMAKRAAANAADIARQIFALAEMYFHFQIGGGSDYHIDASSIDFSHTSQKQLGLSGMIPGEERDVNLFRSGINVNSLRFGKVKMAYKGKNQFSILPNAFDFNIEWQNGMTQRNLGTAFGGVIVYNIIPFWPLKPYVPLILGGPYNVIFDGTATISQ